MKQYQDLLKNIIDNGIEKTGRNGKVKSLFGLTFKHDMQDGFPLITTKKMYWKGIVTELLWFLRGETNIRYLLENDCNIWSGDAYKNYCKSFEKQSLIEQASFDTDPITQELFINKIQTDNDFANEWGDLGSIYGKQWRRYNAITKEWYVDPDNSSWIYDDRQIDQISNLIKELKTDPDSRRMLVSAWNVGELDDMILPPCHYAFQVYTRELFYREQVQWVMKNTDVELENLYIAEEVAKTSTPKRAISLLWNQRSVDMFLGLPFNIASYALLLEIIAKEVNMIPEQLVGSFGDCHIYEEHYDVALQQAIRTPYNLPKLVLPEINPSILEKPKYYKPDDFVIKDYEYHSKLLAKLKN